MNKTSNFRLLIAYILFSVVYISSCVFCSLTNISECNDIQNTDTERQDCPVIIIDAGHGGEDGGTIGVSGVFEKDINLKISFDVYYTLKAAGIPVVLTRDKDMLLYDRTINYQGRKKALDMAKRLETATSYENSIFVSIHQNSFSDSKYSGLQVYYSENNAGSLGLAQTIQELCKNTLQQKNNRKCKPSQNNIYLLDNIYSPAVLVECGFLSNEKECNLLTNDSYQKEIASIISTSIINFIQNDELKY
jgi:N-acetylmuramoyl-L-alanine amidase